VVEILVEQVGCSEEMELTFRLKTDVGRMDKKMVGVEVVYVLGKSLDAKIGRRLGSGVVSRDGTKLGIRVRSAVRTPVVNILGVLLDRKAGLLLMSSNKEGLELGSEVGS